MFRLCVRFFICFFLPLALAVIINCPIGAALEDPAKQLKEVGVDQKLDTQLDTNLQFKDSTGNPVTLGALLASGKPALLIPVYYQCPRLCGFLLSGVTALLNKINLAMGKEFTVLTISFNPEEGPDLALKRQEDYRAKVFRTDVDKNGWHFLVGDQTNVQTLMQAVGFKYYKDEGEFAHTAAIIVLTPQGKISQYFTGIEFSAWDVRLALIEASKGGIGSFVDAILLYCFRFDHTKGQYTWAVFGLLKIGGALTLIGLVLFVAYFVRRGSSEKSRSSKNKLIEA